MTAVTERPARLLPQPDAVMAVCRDDRSIWEWLNVEKIDIDEAGNVRLRTALPGSLRFEQKLDLTFYWENEDGKVVRRDMEVQL